jgi:hypothetical protein
MSYSIIQPPFTLRFHEMPGNQLKDYATWFQGTLPARTEELAKEVRRAQGFEGWEPNLSPESFNSLGAWFENQVRRRFRSTDEIEDIRSRSTFPIDVPSEELTNRTFSLAMDIGMYLGQAVQKNVPGAAWTQFLDNKNLADYGQPVIVGLSMGSLNPVRVVVNLAYGIARDKQDGRRLRELYDIWAKPNLSARQD